MGSRRKYRIKLGERDREILLYTGEQRMTWLEALQSRFYPDHKLDAVKSTVRRLTGHPPHYRFLQPESLDSRRKYWRLTTTGARLIGLPESVARPLGRTALARRYALQWLLVVDQPEQRWACLPADYPELFESTPKRATRSTFYLVNRESGTCLGCIFTDCGSDTRRLSRRAVNWLEKNLQHRWLVDFIGGERFEITILTNATRKAKLIEKQLVRDLQCRLGRKLRSKTGKPTVPCHVLVVPGLIGILPDSSQ